MRLYLAGPMRGYPEFNFPAFRAATANLRPYFEVWSPAEKDEADGFDPTKDEALPLREYMRSDLPALLDCDAVAVLRGWEKSEGARLEVEVARRCGLPVYWSELLENFGAISDLYRVTETESVLDEAERLIHGERNDSYGEAASDFTRTGKMWAAILGIETITPHQVALCMAALKISREAFKSKRDNVVDGCGYLALAFDIANS